MKKMTTSQEYKVDRAGWDPGPWDDEPDMVDFEHVGLPCRMRRNHMGGWCGYVGFQPVYPLYGKSYNNLYDDGVDVNVHGGLTWSDAGDDGLWWFGFDCSHCDDFLPYMHANQKMRDLGIASRPHDGEIYRDMAYARKETESLAEQLSKV